jgi:hypothetical protein
MHYPLFFPIPRVVSKISHAHSKPLADVLQTAGATVRASGPWTLRPIVLAFGQTDILKEATDYGTVQIGVPLSATEIEAARYASLAMAYSLMDLVARESIRGLPWTRPGAAPGRPRTGQALTNAERQRKYRRRHARKKASRKQ